MFNQHPQSDLGLTEDYDFFMLYNPRGKGRLLKVKSGINKRNVGKKYFFTFAKSGSHYNLTLCRPLSDNDTQELSLMRLTIKQGLGYAVEVVDACTDNPLFILKLSSPESMKSATLTFAIKHNALYLANVTSLVESRVIDDVITQGDMSYY